MTLTEFLLARIDEDEAAWDKVDRQVEEWRRDNTATPYRYWRPSPQRLRAECEAKRRVIEAVWDWSDALPEKAYSEVGRCQTSVLRALALPHADHPDYRDEWKL